MCGICFAIIGVKIQNNNIHFNPFSQYINSEFVSNLKTPVFEDNFDFIKDHIIKNNLFIEDFNLSDIKEAISRRGPTSYNILQ